MYYGMTCILFAPTHSQSGSQPPDLPHQAFLSLCTADKSKVGLVIYNVHLSLKGTFYYAEYIHHCLLSYFHAARSVPQRRV